MPALDIPFGLPLTADQFEKIPWVEGLRLELWDGNLDVSASIQIAWHGLVKRRIANVLESEAQDANTGIGVVLSDRTVREPDVTRFRPCVRPELRRSQFPVADVDLVVEIVSPESESRDRKIKPDEYAAAGIPEYWLAEQHPDDVNDAMINIYRLTPSRTYGLVRAVALSALEHPIEQ